MFHWIRYALIAILLCLLPVFCAAAAKPNLVLITLGFHPRRPDGLSRRQAWNYAKSRSLGG